RHVQGGGHDDVVEGQFFARLEVDADALPALDVPDVYPQADVEGGGHRPPEPLEPVLLENRGVKRPGKAPGQDLAAGHAEQGGQIDVLQDVHRGDRGEGAVTVRDEEEGEQVLDAFEPVLGDELVERDGQLARH